MKLKSTKIWVTLGLIFMISCANIQKSDLPPEETKIDIKQVTSVEWFQGRKEPSCAEETHQQL